MVVGLQVVTLRSPCLVWLPACALQIPAVCFIESVDNYLVQWRGYWTGWYRDYSYAVPDELGLFSREALPAGTCLGRITTIHTRYHFIDWPTIRFSNHSPRPNIGLRLVPDHAQQVVHLFGYTLRDIAPNEEMLADYTSFEAPKPTFVTPGGVSNFYTELLQPASVPDNATSLRARLAHAQQMHIT